VIPCCMKFMKFSIRKKDYTSNLPADVQRRCGDASSHRRPGDNVSCACH
jgi:hypothetical protein